MRARHRKAWQVIRAAEAVGHVPLGPNRLQEAFAPDELLTAMLSGDVEVATRHFESADQPAA